MSEYRNAYYSYAAMYVILPSYFDYYYYQVNFWLTFASSANVLLSSCMC